VYVIAEPAEMPPAITSDSFLTVASAVRTSATADVSVHYYVLAMAPPHRPAPELRALLQVWVI
jgi:hypothetical protein